MRAKGRLGPGLVFFFTALGPGTFLTSAVTGATYGYALLWAIAPVSLFRYVWVSTAASYVLVTRESLLQGYAAESAAGSSGPRWRSRSSSGTPAPYTILADGPGGARPDAVAGGRQQRRLVGWPHAARRAVDRWGRLPAGRTAYGGHRSIRRFAADRGRLARPDPRPCCGLFVPTMPDSTGFYSALLLLAAMIGAQIGSMS